MFVPLLDTIGSLVAVILVLIELKRKDFHPFFWHKSCLEKAERFVCLFCIEYGNDRIWRVEYAADWRISSGNGSRVLECLHAANWCSADDVHSYHRGCVSRDDQNKSWKFIKRLLMIFMPIVLAGSVFSVAVAPYVLLIVGGEQYVAATSLFRALVPVLIFSFPGIVLGWPTLGALDKAAQVTKTTILAAVVQVVSLLLLIATGHFTVMWIAIFRCVTEFVLMTCRGWYCWKYRKEFC